MLCAASDVYLHWAREAEALYEPEKAIERYKSALEIDQEYRPKYAAANLNNIGGVYDDLGEKGRALEF